MSSTRSVSGVAVVVLLCLLGLVLAAAMCSRAAPAVLSHLNLLLTVSHHSFTKATDRMAFPALLVLLSGGCL